MEGDIKQRVLILESHHRHSLAVVRSLGKKGIQVFASSDNKHSPAFYSRYCQDQVVYGNSSSNKKFADELLEIVSHDKYEMIIPTVLKGFKILSKYKKEFKKYTKVPVADLNAMEIASNKDKTMQFAKKFAIPIPETFYPESINDVQRISEKIRYPVVIKAIEEWGSVKYAYSPKELVYTYENMLKIFHTQIEKGKFPIIQEYIPGEGYGFFGLFNHGKLRAFFMHKRIHQVPPAGGPSAMARSFYDTKLKQLGEKLLSALKWHGVAMVEFKKDNRDEIYKLMEINPKFWGSLDLAIASGVDFPYLLYKMEMDGDIKPVFDYSKDTIFRWISMDLAYTFKTHSWIEFFKNFFNKKIKDDLLVNDIFPFIIQFLRGVWYTLRSKGVPR